jgi:hypothetical protein
MTFPHMQHMPLTTAYLCQDCDCVGNCSEQCPACASRALMGLERVLNRRLAEAIKKVGRRRVRGPLKSPLAA